MNLSGRCRLAACRNAVLATGVMAVLLLCADQATAREIWFLGVGNDGYFGDVQGLFDPLAAAWTGETLHSRLLEDRTGTEILSDIDWLAASAAPGDLTVLYYSGHAGTAFDAGGDEASGWAATTADELLGLIGGSYVTDDQLAQHLAAVSDQATLLVIIDACYSGGFVGGTQDLNALDNLLFMAACTETQTAAGGDPYSEFTAQLIGGLAGSMPADTDLDGMLTFNEWFLYAFTHTSGQTPISYTSDLAARNYPIVVPEPATATLLCLALLPLIRRRR